MYGLVQALFFTLVVNFRFFYSHFHVTILGLIPRVDQNQHHCLVEKGDLQRLGEETPTETQPA